MQRSSASGRVRAPCSSRYFNSLSTAMAMEIIDQPENVHEDPRCVLLLVVKFMRQPELRFVINRPQIVDIVLNDVARVNGLSLIQLRIEQAAHGAAGDDQLRAKIRVAIDVRGAEQCSPQRRPATDWRR